VARLYPGGEWAGQPCRLYAPDTLVTAIQMWVSH